MHTVCNVMLRDPPCRWAPFDVADVGVPCGSNLQDAWYQANRPELLPRTRAAGVANLTDFRGFVSDLQQPGGYKRLPAAPPPASPGQRQLRNPERVDDPREWRCVILSYVSRSKVAPRRAALLSARVSPERTGGRARVPCGTPAALGPRRPRGLREALRRRRPDAFVGLTRAGGAAGRPVPAGGYASSLGAAAGFGWSAALISLISLPLVALTSFIFFSDASYCSGRAAAPRVRRHVGDLRLLLRQLRLQRLRAHVDVGLELAFCAWCTPSSTSPPCSGLERLHKFLQVLELAAALVDLALGVRRREVPSVGYPVTPYFWHKASFRRQCRRRRSHLLRVLVRRRALPRRCHLLTVAHHGEELDERRLAGAERACRNSWW